MTTIKSIPTANLRPASVPITRHPIGMVRLFSNDDTPDMDFAPQADITPYECAMLLNLAIMMLRPYGVLDWRGYIKQHQLTKHFTEIPK